MGSGKHGGFGSSYGARYDEIDIHDLEDIFEDYFEEDDSEYEERYVATRELREHIEKPDISRLKKGIRGGHKKDEFLKALEGVGGRIVGIEQSREIEGIEIVSYLLPKLDRTGKRTGEYRTQTFKKTIYDSKIISTNEYIERGIEAVNNIVAINSDGSRTGIDNKGIYWIYYVDTRGNVSTLFPRD